MQNDHDAEEALLATLRRGSRHLKRARLAAVVTLVVLIAHFEYLVMPCARAAGGLRGLLLIAYPVAFAGLVLSTLWQRAPSRHDG